MPYKLLMSHWCLGGTTVVYIIIYKACPVLCEGLFPSFRKVCPHQLRVPVMCTGRRDCKNDKVSPVLSFLLHMCVCVCVFVCLCVHEHACICICTCVWIIMHVDMPKPWQMYVYQANKPWVSVIVMFSLIPWEPCWISNKASCSLDGEQFLLLIGLNYILLAS